MGLYFWERHCTSLIILFRSWNLPRSTSVHLVRCGQVLVYHIPNCYQVSSQDKILLPLVIIASREYILIRIYAYLNGTIKSFLSSVTSLHPRFCHGPPSARVCPSILATSRESECYDFVPLYMWGCLNPLHEYNKNQLMLESLRESVSRDGKLPQSCL